MKNKKIAFCAFLGFALILTGGALLAQNHSPFAQQAEVPSDAAATEEEQAPSGENFKGFYFGAKLKDFKNILKIRPAPVMIDWDENGCDFYSPKADIVIGDFTVNRSDIYLVFYKEQLVRIRLVNNFRSVDDQDYRFFNALRTALMDKYGKVQSDEPEGTRFDGRYTWKTDKLRIVLTYSALDYNWLDLERELRSEFKTPSKITSTDL
ncbi:MAG: hypothetical protein LBC99_03450 [Spirochaetota bacterium]|jgi:hypothetical protein|nr:hypothetical protein [Spirochaetota bacterium]